MKSTRALLMRIQAVSAPTMDAAASCRTGPAALAAGARAPQAETVAQTAARQTTTRAA